uniref:Uncharacterized protein n=1 Tax=Vitis vinifera TaxID=29760 RepID=F6H3G2_VITVI
MFQAAVAQYSALGVYGFGSQSQIRTLILFGVVILAVWWRNRCFVFDVYALIQIWILCRNMYDGI